MKRFISRLKFKHLLVVGFLCLGIVKINVPFIIMHPNDIHCDSISQIIKVERNVWEYRPLCDTLYIQDSVRNIKLIIKEACAYEAKRFDHMYFQWFLPWAKVYNPEGFKLFGIWFDYENFEDNLNQTYALTFQIGDGSKDQMFGGPVYMDNEAENYSYYGRRVDNFLPDTISLKVWGYPGLFMKRSQYRKLTEEEQTYVIRLSNSLRKDKILLGEVTFLKGDSTLFQRRIKNESDKLFIKNLSDY